MTDKEQLLYDFVQKIASHEEANNEEANNEDHWFCHACQIETVNDGSDLSDEAWMLLLRVDTMTSTGTREIN